MASRPELIFRRTDEDQPAIDLPEELGHIMVDLTNPNSSVAGLSYGNKAKTTGATTTTGQIVVAKVDQETGQRTGEVALAPIPRINDKKVQ